MSMELQARTTPVPCSLRGNNYNFAFQIQLLKGKIRQHVYILRLVPDIEEPLNLY